MAGVGYSLGGIVINNYVATYGQDCALDVAVSISGALATRFQQYYERSKYTWQPLIGGHQRDHFLNEKWGKRLLQRLGQEDFRNMLRSTNVVVSFKKEKSAKAFFIFQINGI